MIGIDKRYIDLEAARSVFEAYDRCVETGQADEALNVCETALNDHPDNAELRYRLGVLHAEIGTLPDALARLLEASERNPTCGDYQFAVAQVSELSGQLSSAIDHYRQGLAIAPQNTDARIGLILLLLKSGQYEDAWQETILTITGDHVSQDIHRGLFQEWFSYGKALLGEAENVGIELAETKFQEADFCLLKAMDLCEDRKSADAKEIHSLLTRITITRDANENYLRVYRAAKKSAGPIPNCGFDPNTIDTVVAITYHGRSGSYLLQSLFDGHPEVLTLRPSNFLQVFDIADEHRLDTNTLLNFFDRYGQKLFHEESKRFSLFLTIHELARRFYVPGTSLRGFLFRAYHVAGELLNCGRDVSRATAIAYGWHNHDPEQAEAIAASFENCFFIQTVRTPAESLGSHFRHHIEQVAYGVSRTIYPAVLLRRFFSDGIPVTRNGTAFAVRLEDIHGDAPNLTRRLAEWIGIDWHESLLESTFDGIPFTQSGVEGIGHGKVSKRRPQWMSKIDELRVVICLWNTLEAWRYPGPAWLANRTARLLIGLVLTPFPFRAEWQGMRYAISKDGMAPTIALRQTMANYWKTRGLILNVMLDRLPENAREPLQLLPLGNRETGVRNPVERTRAHRSIDPREVMA